MPDLLKRAAMALGLQRTEPASRKRRNLYGSDGNIPYKVDNRGNLIKKRSYKSSALGKSVEDAQREAEQKDGIIASLKEKTNRFFFLSIPETLQESVSNLPVVYIVSFGLFANLLFLGSFIFFTNYTYEANISSPFLAASKASGVCQSVGKEISGTYLFDSNGVWSGSKSFLSNDAIYRFEFNNYAPNATYTYSQFIDMYRTNFLIDISALSVNQSLPINLLYWMKFRGTITTSSGSEQVMRFTGSSENVFDTKKYLVGLSNGVVDMGQCTSVAKPSHSYYRYSSSITFTWTNDVFAESCFSNVTSSAHLGYDPNFDGDLFSLSFNFETLVSAVAVNWGGIIPLSAMTGVSNTTVVSHRGFRYSASYYFDDTKPAMQAFLCLKLLESSSYYSVRNNFESFCFVELGTYFALPIFNHIGYADAATGEMTDCSCPVVDSYCHKLDLLSGLLFYPNENYADPTSNSIIFASGGVKLSADLLELVWNYTAKELNSVSYDAMVGTVYSVYFLSNLLSSNSYDFCNNTCAIVTINSYTDNAYPKVSDYYHYLTEGSCSNSFINANWDEIKTSTPTSLLETYVLCTPTIRDAFQNALGVAQGLATTLHPFLLVICLPLIYIFLKYNGLLVYLEETYTKIDKEVTLNELAEYILLVRDGRRTNLPEGSTVVQIANEMIVAARNHILDEESRIEQMYDEFKDLKKLRSKRRLTSTNALKEKVKGKLKHINKKSIMSRGAAASGFVDGHSGVDDHAGEGVTLTPSFSTHIDIDASPTDNGVEMADYLGHPPASPESQRHFRRYSTLPTRAGDAPGEGSLFDKLTLTNVFEAGSGVEEKQETGHFNELNKELTGLLSFLDPASVSGSRADEGLAAERARGDLGIELSVDGERPAGSAATGYSTQSVPPGAGGGQADARYDFRSASLGGTQGPPLGDVSYLDTNHNITDNDDDDDDDGSAGSDKSISSFSDEEVQKISMPPPFRSAAKRPPAETVHEL